MNFSHFRILFILYALVSIKSSFAETVSSTLFADSVSVPSMYLSGKDCKKIKNRFVNNKKDKLNLQTFFSNRSREEISFEFFNRDFANRIGHEINNLEKISYIKGARCFNLIDDIVYDLFYTYFQKVIAEESGQAEGRSFDSANINPSMNLMDYLDKKQELLSVSKKKVIEGEDYPFSLEDFYAKTSFGKISVREKLYAYYSVDQIKRMSEIMDFILNVMDASKVETTVYFSEDQHRENYVIDHTAADVYRLALSIFIKERKKLFMENKQRLPFSPLDFLVASYEMGVLSKSEVSLLTQDPTFYKKDITMLKKITGYIARLGLTAAQINPATAPYALVAMIIYNSYHEMHNQTERIEYENFYFPEQGMN